MNFEMTHLEARLCLEHLQYRCPAGGDEDRNGMFLDVMISNQ